MHLVFMNIDGRLATILDIEQNIGDIRSFIKPNYEMKLLFGFY